MQKRQFISSNNLNQGKQIQKFQIPQRKPSQGRLLQQQYTESSSGNNTLVKLQKAIYQKIYQVQTQNKKLLDIAVRVNNSALSFSNDDKLHHVIYGIEQQMKSAFNQLIQSIQQFYIDIDTKIKQIGAYLTSLSGVQTLQTSKNYHQDHYFTQTNNQQRPSMMLHQQQTLRSINNKIQSLQKDLQQTKSNENKLMTIIQKLVSKYQLTHQTTIVRDDPFLKRKMQNLSGRSQGNEQRSRNNDLVNIIEQLSVDHSDKFMEGNSFAKTNNHPMNQGNTNHLTKGPLLTSNAVKKMEFPQKLVHHNQNANDYSIYHQLNKIQENPSQKPSHNNYKSNISNASLQNHLMQKIKSKQPQNFQQKYGASTVSVTSYAYSNPVSQPEDDQCFIKKLYSKQPTTLNKVSLKGCTTNNNSFFQYKAKEQPIDQRNKNHRQAFLITQLKRQN